MKPRRTPDDFAAEMKARLNARIRDIPIPERMRHLPISPEGYPVPWFVAKFQGEYDFRIAVKIKLARAVNNKLCWLCGQQLGKHLAFCIGPMCMVNRVTSEPPCHKDCAEYAVHACPFLTQPRMRRNEKDLPDDRVEPGGFGAMRNPGVAILWITQSYEPFKPEAGKPGLLFRIGKAESIQCYSEGRPATRAEVVVSIDSGMDFLRRVAKLQGVESELGKQYAEAVDALDRAGCWPAPIALEHAK